MQKNKIAFTLVELMVVSTIIVLLSASSVFYFFDFTDKQELLIHVSLLEDEIEELDRQVKDFEISDYTLTFIPEYRYFL